MTAPAGRCVRPGHPARRGAGPPALPGPAPGSAAAAMKPCEEEEEEGRAAAAGGGGGDPWKECVEVAVQLARRAGQVRESRPLPRAGPGCPVAGGAFPGEG